MDMNKLDTVENLKSLFGRLSHQERLAYINELGTPNERWLGNDHYGWYVYDFKDLKGEKHTYSPKSGATGLEPWYLD